MFLKPALYLVYSVCSFCGLQSVLWHFIFFPALMSCEAFLFPFLATFYTLNYKMKYLVYRDCEIASLGNQDYIFLCILVLLHAREVRYD